MGRWTALGDDDVGGKLGRAEWEGGRVGRGGEASGGYAASRAHAGILKELFLFVFLLVNTFAEPNVTLA